MSKKPPIVIVPPLTAPPLPPDGAPPVPGAPGIAAGLAPAWAPDTWPGDTSEVEAGWVKDLTGMPPSTAPMTSAAPSSETAMRSRKPRDIQALPLEGVGQQRPPCPLSDPREDQLLPEFTALFSGVHPPKRRFVLG